MYEKGGASAEVESRIDEDVVNQNKDFQRTFERQGHMMRRSVAMGRKMLL